MSDRKEWQHSYQPMNYNDYYSYGSNSQSIDQNYGQYSFTHQGGPNNQYGSSSQFGSQYGGHNYVGEYDVMNQNGSNDQNGFDGQYDSTYQYGSGSQFNGQHGGNNNHGQNNIIYQNYANGQHGYNGQYNQVAGGQNNSVNISNQPSYGLHQANQIFGCNDQNNINIGERSYVDRMDKEHQNFIKEISEVKDMMDEFHASNELLFQGLREVTSRLVVEEQALSHNLKSQPQQENHQVTTIRSLILPTYVEENEVDRQYLKEKDVDESALEFSTPTHLPFENLTLVEKGKSIGMVAVRPPVSPTFPEENEVNQEYVNERKVDESALELKTQIDFPIETLTLVEEEKSTQENAVQQAVEVGHQNMAQLDTSILEINDQHDQKEKCLNKTQPEAVIIDMVVGDQSDVTRLQLEMVDFIKPQQKAKSSQSRGLGGQGNSASIKGKNGYGDIKVTCTPIYSLRNREIHAENKKGSQRGIKHGWPPPWSP
ncbi:unnamed protein product [Prunus armeniaca]